MDQKMCEECGEHPANVHLTQIHESATVISHLCDVCARKFGIGITDDFAAMAPTIDEEKSEPDIVCQRCGLAYSAYKKQGRVGCAQCYEAFGERIDDLLMQVLGCCEHKGKNNKPDNCATIDVERLRDDLRTAIVQEEFELAASLRDKIRSLEQLLCKGP